MFYYMLYTYSSTSLEDNTTYWKEKDESHPEFPIDNVFKSVYNSEQKVSSHN